MFLSVPPALQAGLISIGIFPACKKSNSNSGCSPSIVGNWKLIKDYGIEVDSFSNLPKVSTYDTTYKQGNPTIISFSYNNNYSTNSSPTRVFNTSGTYSVSNDTLDIKYSNPGPTAKDFDIGIYSVSCDTLTFIQSGSIPLSYYSDTQIFISQ